jgi:hypothetical protein
VRADDAHGKVWLKSTDWKHIHNMANHAAMYVAREPQLFRLAPKDASTAQVDETTRRVSILISGLQISMPEQTRNDA